MKTLGIKPEGTGDKENLKNILPATLNDDDDVSLLQAIFASVIGHIIVPLMLWLFISLVLFILTILGIKFTLFEKPPTKMRDIEFVLVNTPEQQPINKNTKYRADRNSRAGGKHDPTRAVSAPSPVSAPSKPQRAATPPAPKQQPKPAKKAAQPKQQQQPQKKTAQQPKPKTAPPRLAPNNSLPKPKPSTTPGYKIPVPPVKKPQPAAKAGSTNGTPSGSPLGTINPGSSKGRTASSSAGRSSSSGQGKANSPYSLGSGNIGNPSPGNPNGRPGIDAIKEPDFGPYMRDLQDRIKRRWEPPRGNESKRVVLLFKIAKDGRLLSVSMVKSSGLPAADKAAISAVENAAPFKPLPPEFRGSNVEIQFTFDYNVFGASRY